MDTEKFLRMMPLGFAVLYLAGFIFCLAATCVTGDFDGFHVVGIVGSAVSSALCAAIYRKQD